MKLLLTAASLVVLSLVGSACVQPPVESQEQGQRLAEEFVRTESTFCFDGIPETLKVASTASVVKGWKYTIEFDSRHAGYGNRTGEVLAQVITHHTAVVTIESGEVTSAIMDGIWNMIDHQMLDNTEVSLAPIDEVDVYFMESFPVQVGVHIKGGLRDGCTTFRDAVITREGNTVNIEVTTQRPRDAICSQVYSYFERNLNLGSDFKSGTEYTLNVNDYATTFLYQ
jgi:hypothetical protein